MSVRARKKSVEKLPEWKLVFKRFNERWFSWLETFVDKAIIWLVILLFFIILGEFSGLINAGIAKIIGHETHFLHSVEEFVHHHHDMIIMLDQVIIAFFMLDLYFHFFTTPTFKTFLKKYYLDIIAVTPVALVFKGLRATRMVEIGEQINLAQGITHVTTETERVLIEGERTARLLTEAEKGTKVTRLSPAAARSARFIRVVTRLPRFVRLWRLTEVFKKRK